MKKIINWKLFIILLSACVFASFLVIPYTLELTSNKVNSEVTPLLMILATAGQSIVMFGIVIFVGLLMVLCQGNDSSMSYRKYNRTAKLSLQYSINLRSELILFK